MNRVRQALPLALLMATAYPVSAVAQNRAAPANYTCEGSMARIASNGFTGDQRGEWQVNFRMNVNRAAGTVMIFAVSGTSIIKPGRHTLAADRQGKMAISWTVTDQTNRSQPVTMTVTRDGEFSGRWSETSPTAGAEAMMGVIFGTNMGSAMRVTLNGSFSGVCWQ